MTLAQIVASDPKVGTSSAWIALQVFTYGSIISNITTAMLALLAIIFCTELPLKTFDQGYTRNTIDLSSLEQIPALLREFGMSKYYKWVIWGQLSWLILSIIFTFLALITWVRLSQPGPVFWISFIIAILGFGGLSICLFGHLIDNTTRGRSSRKSCSTAPEKGTPSGVVS